MSILAYPQPGKDKSERLLVAFCAGAGGYIAPASRGLQPGSAAFYGTIGLEALFNQARARGDWFYLDNAFLDAARGTHYRIGRDRLQGPLCAPDPARLARLGVQVKPWTGAGGHVLVCPQSDYFMRQIAGWDWGVNAWVKHVTNRIALATDREIRVREWHPDKIKLGKTLAEDLRDCWALVTHSSAAANEALLAGVPVVTTGDCAAAEFSGALEEIEAPRRPEGRESWAARLAASQWTIEEMRAGIAWRALNQEGRA